MVWAKIKVHGSKDLYIGSFYRSPDNHDPDYIGHLQMYVERIPTSHGAHLWLGGDFNLADIDWQNECTTTYPTHGAQYCQLLTASEDAFLTQMVTEPTRITESSSSDLDLFFTNNDTLVNQTGVLPGISDHEAVFIESSLRPMKKISSPRRVYKYHKADYENFRKDFQKFSEEFVEKVATMDIQTMWNKFKTTIHTLMDKHIPHKIIRGDKKPKPWITKSVRDMHRKRDKLYKKQRSSKGPKDISSYKTMKARARKAERQAYWNYLDKMLDFGDPETEYQTGKMKPFWSFVKSLQKDNSGVTPLKDQGKIHADPVDKANILNRQYESVFTKEKEDEDTPVLEGNPYPEMPSIMISEEVVLKLLKKINPHKASGPDMIPACILKDLSDVIAPILTMIFQRTLTLGEVPEDWKSANVTPIFKKGDQFKASNYRPV